MEFSFENKRQVTLLVILVALIWLFFPFLFKAFMFWMDVVGVELQSLAAYGPIGDIYGSLNTLFTSATLAFVIYSTILQRQANQDARETMTSQLKQARDATANQLKQARNSLNQQLDQARESTRLQLELASKTYDIQEMASNNAALASTFSILLNQKRAVLESIYNRNEDLKPQEVFEKICVRFLSLLHDGWNEFDLNNDDEYSEIQKELERFLAYEIGRSLTYNELTTHFYMLIPIIKLIKNSNVDRKTKDIYYDTLNCSMTHDEQVSLIWFASTSNDIKSILRNTNLIDTFFDKKSMNFLVKNFDRSIFMNSSVLDNWDDH